MNLRSQKIIYSELFEPEGVGVFGGLLRGLKGGGGLFVGGGQSQVSSNNNPKVIQSNPQHHHPWSWLVGWLVTRRIFFFSSFLLLGPVTGPGNLTVFPVHVCVCVCRDLFF